MIYDQEYKHCERSYKIQISRSSVGSMFPPLDAADTFLLEVKTHQNEIIYTGTVSYLVAYGIYSRWKIKPLDYLLEEGQNFIKETEGGKIVKVGEAKIFELTPFDFKNTPTNDRHGRM